MSNFKVAAKSKLFENSLTRAVNADLKNFEEAEEQVTNALVDTTHKMASTISDHELRLEKLEKAAINENSVNREKRTKENDAISSAEPPTKVPRFFSAGKG
jgi:precorrin-6x reductase